MMSYARKPRNVHWKDDKGYRRKNVKQKNALRHSDRDFMDALWRGEYVRCDERWRKDHRCAENAAREHTEDRLWQGVPAIHIVVELINDHERDLQDDGTSPSIQSGSAENDAADTFAALMDGDTGLEEKTETEDTIEQELYVHTMHAALSDEKSFRLGDEGY